ncbi:MAG: hypothetical protein A4E53_01330 [Pelotomaculum sp. PtaB.Bin104]|nr:MAG: hypothetical protein A4E53_01330 [Pelotomaculum sp. PtaB.Bin104]
MSVINMIVFYSIIIPLILVFLIYLDKKYMWAAPIIMLLLIFLNLLHDLLRLSHGEPFIDLVLYYFHNDTMMTFLLYIPIFIVTILYTTVFYIIKYMLKVKQNRGQ